MHELDRPFHEGAALLDLGERETVLAVSGSDAEDFLQRMLSCDVRRSTCSDGSGVGIPGTLMAAKGKLIAPFDLLRIEEGFLLRVERSAYPELHAALDRVLILEEVELADAGLRIISVQGPEAASRLGGDDEPLPLGALEHVPLDLGEGPRGRVLRNERSRAGGWDLLLPAGRADALIETLRADGAVVVDDAAIDRQRIAAGIPRFGIDGTDSNLPTEAGYDAAIVYDKGCYAGQEVMARIRTYGHVNRRLCQLRCTDGEVPSVGATIQTPDADAKKLGAVTSATEDPESGPPVALGFVRYRFAEVGTTVSIEGAGTATVERIIGDEVQSGA